MLYISNICTTYLHKIFDQILIIIIFFQGFQHQIRAHLSFGIGCPILGDHKYSHNISNIPQVNLFKLN